MKYFLKVKISAFFRLAYRFFASRFYADETVTLLLHEKSIAQSSPVEIRRATLENIHDLRAFQPEYYVDLIGKCLVSGDTGYLGYLDGKCVHRSLVSSGPREVKLHKFIPMQLSENEVFIHFCETAPFARGKNIFAHVLSVIAADFKGKKIWISASSGNSASLRSMAKAGFVEKEKKRIVVILGIKRICRPDDTIRYSKA